MRALTPTRLRRTILPLSYAIYFIGLIVSTTVFFHGKHFDPAAALLSDLASPEGNPHGYLALVIATVLTSLLLLPAALIFHRSFPTSPLTHVATICFSAGIAAALLITILAPIADTYSTLHIQLAYAAFAGIILGTTLFLIAARAAYTLIAIQMAILLFLIWEYFGPDLLTGTHLFNSLAFCEWVLCLNCAIALWMLAAYAERNHTRTTGVAAA